MFVNQLDLVINSLFSHKLLNLFFYCNYHVSMKNMEKNLLICWMGCLPLFFLILGIKVLLLLVMLLALPLYTWAGVMMVCGFCYNFLLFHFNLNAVSASQIELAIVQFK